MLRHGTADVPLVALALAHGALLLAGPPAPVIGIAFWWSANTIAHNFIHQPFFSSRRANGGFSVALSVLLGLPQTLWRDRHLAHHADRPWRLRWSRQMGLDSGAVLVLWTLLALAAPAYMAGAWIPGLLLGLALSWLQGHFEHAHGTTSHYGRLYNRIFFNDGFHVEHHERPGVHWSVLPSLGQNVPVISHKASVAMRSQGAAVSHSRWPAVLRWLDAVSLDGLEHAVTRSPRLQRWVVSRHERAFRRLLRDTAAIKRVVIVGGGIFPRSALVLRRVVPHAHLTVIDRDAGNVRSAGRWLDDDVRTVVADYEPALAQGADLIVVPLAFRGDRTRFHHSADARMVLVHDWLWQRRGVASAIVSPLLLKRVNLMRSP
jgi:hypothetical protein